MGQWQFHWQEQLPQPCPLNHNQLPRTTTSEETFITRLSQGGGTLRWFFESQWLDTHRRLSWPGPSECKLPQPNLSNSSKSCGAHRLNSWLIGSLMATTTLHTSSIPPWGMLQFSARRTGTNPVSPVITNCYHSYPSQHVWTTLSILLWNPY